MTALSLLLWLHVVQAGLPADVLTVLQDAPERHDVAAVWLRRARTVEWQPGGRVVRTLRGTLQVLDRGSSSYGTIDLGWFGPNQDVEVVRAISWQDPSGPAHEGAERRFALGADRFYLLQLAFPEPGPGGGLDYEVRIADRDPTEPDGLADRWVLQAPEPVERATYVVRLPQGSSREPTAPVPLPTPSVRQGADGVVESTWTLSGLAPLGSSTGDPVAILYSTVKSWDAIAAQYRRAAADRYTTHPRLLEKVALLTKGAADPVRAIYEWVVSQFAYTVGPLERGAPGLVPREARQTYFNPKGDCKDAATLLITMLRVAHVEAWPVLTRTSDQGIIDTGLPAMQQFNHLLVAAQTAAGPKYLDPAWELGPYDYPPWALHGVSALVVRDDSCTWVTLPKPPPAKDNAMIRTGSFVLDAAGRLSGEVRIQRTGLWEQAWRYRWSRRHDGVARSKLALEWGLRQQRRLLADPASITAPEPEDLQAPCVVSFRLLPSEYLRNGSMALRCALFDRSEVPAALLAPTGSVDLEEAPTLTEEHLTFKLPAGWSVLRLPAPWERREAWGRWRVTYKRIGDTLEYARTVVIETPKIALSQAGAAWKWYEDLAAADLDITVELDRR